MFSAVIALSLLYEISSANAEQTTCVQKSTNASFSAATTRAPLAFRQCLGAFFSADTSAWFTVECLVQLETAQVGAYTSANVPGLGSRQVWVLKVYAQPKLAPPQFDAVPNPAAGPTSARLELHLPERASLIVNGKPVRQPNPGMPVAIEDLEPNATYEYRIGVEVRRDDKAVLDERVIAFRAGETVRVDFTRPVDADASF